MRRKMTPATTTEVRAGTNIILLKAVFPTMCLLLGMVARIMGMGIISAQESIVYKILFLKHL